MISATDLKQISELLDQKFDQKLAPINKDLGDIKKDVDVLKKDVKRIKKDQSVMLDMLDREQMTQRKRITRIETHLQLSPLP